MRIVKTIEGEKVEFYTSFRHGLHFVTVSIDGQYSFDCYTWLEAWQYAPLAIADKREFAGNLSGENYSVAAATSRYEFINAAHWAAHDRSRKHDRAEACSSWDDEGAYDYN